MTFSLLHSKSSARPGWRQKTHDASSMSGQLSTGGNAIICYRFVSIHAAADMQQKASLRVLCNYKGTSAMHAALAQNFMDLTPV